MFKYTWEIYLSFSEFELNQELTASLNGAGYENPTLLQKQIIPLILQRENLIVGSQTASGKTGAFLIPMASYLIDKPIEEHQGSRILILTSRRERVNHINYTLKRIFKNYTIRVGFISGGRPYQHQMRLLKRPLDVLIATPGRLNDLVENNKANFTDLEMLIIDDYTTIYHHGLENLFATILKQASANCQCVSFVQATDESETSIKTLLPNAISIEVAEEKHPLVSIPQEVYIADDHTHKIALMDQMLDELEDQALIYTSSNRSADALVENLVNHGHPAKRSQQADEPVTAEEHPLIVLSDETNINVVTSGYQNIIHFELPKQTSIFQNRIINKGWEELEKPAAIIVGPHDRLILKKIETESGESLKQNTLIGLEPLNTYTSTPLLSLNKNKPKAKGKKQKIKAKRKSTRSLNTNARKNNNSKQKSHKGQYGRLSGGIHRKRSSHNSNGNGNQKSPLGQGHKNKSQHNKNNRNANSSQYRSKSFSNPAIQELGERTPKKRSVVIRYKERKKRSSTTRAKLVLPTSKSSSEQVD